MECSKETLKTDATNPVTYMYGYMYMQIYVNTHTCMHVCICMCICTCMCVGMRCMHVQFVGWKAREESCASLI